MLTRFVSVPNPEPASATSLATSRSTPLRLSFSAARSSEPVSAAKPTRYGPRLHGLCGRLAIAVGAADDPRELGQDVGRGLELERQPGAGALELRVGGAHRPEVGHGRGHDERIEAGGAVGSVGEAQQGGPQLGGRFDVDDLGTVRQRHLEVGRHDRDLGATIQCRRGDRRTHPTGRSIADEAHRIDGLARAAGADDDVATRQVRVARAVDEGWAPARVGGPDRGAADGRDHRIHDRRQVGQPPDPRLPRGQLTGRGLHDPVPEPVPQSRDIRPRRRMGPHVAVHRRRDDDRRGGGQDRGRHHVPGQSVGHRPQEVRGRGRHHDRVGAIGDDDVPDPAVRQQLEDVGLDRMPR